MVIAVSALAASLLWPAPAGAQTPPAAELRWGDAWHEVRAWQYPTTVAMLGFGLTARFVLPDPEPNWRGAWEVEQAILDAIGVRDDPARENIEVVSDITFGGAMAYRVFDSLLLPGVFYGNWDLAWQLSWIDLQSFGLVATVVWGSQLFVGRVRPTSLYCDDPTRKGHSCDPNGKDYARSFIAGHPATAITAAGLTCLHHKHLPLYGGGMADKIACGALIGNAVVNAATRLMAEDHYPSDVLFGTVLGLTAGWVLPQALHYGWGDEDDETAETAETAGLPDEQRDANALQFSVAPSMVDGGGGLMVLGRW